MDRGTPSAPMTALGTNILIVGCGYVGLRLAQHLRTHEVTGIVRSAESAARLHAAGIRPLQMDLDRSDMVAPFIPDGGVVFYLAPPPGSGESDTRVSRFLERSTAAPTSFIYMSTTGVYGDTDGAMVDESKPPTPMSDRAQRR